MGIGLRACTASAAGSMVDEMIGLLFAFVRDDGLAAGWAYAVAGQAFFDSRDMYDFIVRLATERKSDAKCPIPAVIDLADPWHHGESKRQFAHSNNTAPLSYVRVWRMKGARFRRARLNSGRLCAIKLPTAPAPGCLPCRGSAYD